VLKFHSALLAPAVVADAAIQPVAIRFERADGSLCVEAAYDGDKSFWDALRGMTTQRAIDAHVCFLSTVPHAQQHRRNVAAEVRNAIVLTLSPEALRNRTARAVDLRA
jgi:hypothetical protein